VASSIRIQQRRPLLFQTCLFVTQHVFCFCRTSIDRIMHIDLAYPHTYTHNHIFPLTGRAMSDQWLGYSYRLQPSSLPLHIIEHFPISSTPHIRLVAFVPPYIHTYSFFRHRMHSHVHANASTRFAGKAESFGARSIRLFDSRVYRISTFRENRYSSE
jgi:hypothetical protein